MWRRPSAVIFSMRVVVRAILGKWSGMEDLGLGLGFDVYVMFLWFGVLNVGEDRELHRRRLLFVRFGSSLLRIGDDCCLVEKKDLRPCLVSGYCLETVVSLVSFSFEGGIEKDLFLQPLHHCWPFNKGNKSALSSIMNNG
jgi:hypothetical protein